MSTHLFKALMTTVIFFVGMILLDYIFFHELRVDGTRIVVTLGFFTYDLASRIHKERRLKKANRYSLVVGANHGQLCHSGSSQLVDGWLLLPNVQIQIVQIPYAGC